MIVNRCRFCCRQAGKCLRYNLLAFLRTIVCCDKLDSEIVEQPAYTAVHFLRDAFERLGGRWRHPGHNLLGLRRIFHVFYPC
jgi:hypothetical protein